MHCICWGAKSNVFLNDYIYFEGGYIEIENCENSAKNEVHNDREKAKRTFQILIHIRVWKDGCKLHKYVGMYSSKKRRAMSCNSKSISYWRWTLFYTIWSDINLGRHET